jgi:type IV secretory pathway TrbD component
MTTWTVVDDHDDAEHFAVTLSAEGLRRAANDNALLAATARTHEILAGTACGGIVVAIVWAIYRSL